METQENKHAELNQYNDKTDKSAILLTPVNNFTVKYRYTRL